jgi:maltokinase
VRSSALVAALGFGELPERPITVDQTNESVVVGERFVVKWLREPVADHPAPVLLSHLAQVGFTDTAGLIGSMSDASGLRALVTSYLPGALDGWDWCIEDLLAASGGFGAPGFGAGLGSLAGALHVALATPSAVWPSPIAAATPPSAPAWTANAAALLESVFGLVDGSDGTWLRSREAALRADLALPPDVTGTPLIRVHGDLHVGQILRWEGGLAVIDFDGSPLGASEPIQPPARDVAQLMMSLEHVAFAAERRVGGPQPSSGAQAGVTGFIPILRTEFLAAYRTKLAEHDMSGLLDERLLPAFEVEQELRELSYATRFLPRWRYAPMAALRRRYGVGINGVETLT